jgi:hypothetical protein
MKNLCNSMKKPTGWTGENGDRICWCIGIKKKSMKKTHSKFLGLSSDKDNNANRSPIGSADEGGLDDKDDGNVIEPRSVLNTSIELDNVDNNGEPHNDMPPLAIPCPLVQRDAAGNNNEDEEVTLHPQGDVNVSVALRRASSTMRAEKPTNSSNKNKERTSIAGAIVKLLEQQQPLSNNERNEMSAMMTMTIMRQMENLNKIMEDCDHCKMETTEEKACEEARKEVQEAPCPRRPQ